MERCRHGIWKDNGPCPYRDCDFEFVIKEKIEFVNNVGKEIQKEINVKLNGHKDLIKKETKLKIPEDALTIIEVLHELIEDGTEAHLLVHALGKILISKELI